MRTRTRGDVNMLQGAMLSSVIRFMVPLMLTSVLQCLYNAADMIIVGKFASTGQDAQAAVGATAAIWNLIVTFVIGIATGANIILARALGAKDFDRASKTVHTSFLFSAILGAAVLTVGLLTSRPMLRFTACDPRIIDDAELYLNIIYLGAPASAISNYMLAVLRTKGDSKHPLYYLAISGLVNVALNILFVAVFHLDVFGVALSTLISQYLSVALILRKLAHLPKDDPCRLRLSRMRMDRQVLGRVIRFGLPSAISSSMYSISNIQIQSAINAYGPYATAANSASGSIEGFVTSATGSMSAASAAFIGQNIGADQRERVRKLTNRLYVFGMLLALLIEIPVLIFGRQLLGIYLSTPEAVSFGLYRLRFVVGVMVVNAVMNVNSGTLQAFGYTMFSMLNSLFGVCAFRLFWTLAIYPYYKTPFTLFVCYPISWMLVAIVGFVAVRYLLYRYSKGRNYSV